MPTQHMVTNLSLGEALLSKIGQLERAAGMPEGAAPARLSVGEVFLNAQARIDALTERVSIDSRMPE